MLYKCIMANTSARCTYHLPTIISFFFLTLSANIVFFDFQKEIKKYSHITKPQLQLIKKTERKVTVVNIDQK